MLPVDYPRRFVSSWKIKPAKFYVGISILLTRKEIEAAFLGKIDKQVCREKAAFLDEPPNFLDSGGRDHSLVWGTPVWGWRAGDPMSGLTCAYWYWSACWCASTSAPSESACGSPSASA